MKKLGLCGISLILTSSLICQVADIMNRPLQAERLHDFDVIHYRIELDFDLAARTFSGTNTIELIPVQDGFKEVSLDASEIKVTSVEDSSGGQLVFSQDSLSVKILLAETYNKGQKILLRVAYSGYDPSDGILFHDGTERYPRMVESNSWPDHARYWFPCYDYPNDKATQEVIVTVAKPDRVLSNGRLVDIRDNGESRTYHWYQDQPHSTYLSMLAIAPFSVLNDSLGDLPVNYWVYEGDEGNAERIFSITPDLIAFYNRIFDYEYPWDKYDQVIGPTQGGGAEATSATILGLGAIHEADDVQDNNWKRIIAHEIAHQWWGDLITLRTWSETWMNEGFGTYSDYLYTEYFRGENEAALDLEGKKLSYLNEAKNRYQRPVVFNRYSRPQDNFDRHTYQKAATILHMLRSLIGDEAFFNTLSHFLHKHEFGVVETKDFIISIREVTGQNLEWFFDQWIYKPGHPVFNVSKIWDEENRVLTFTVKQVQDSHQGVPVFRVPLRVGLYLGSGEIIYKDVWLEKSIEEFSWKLEGEPDMVRFDVGNVLLKEWSYLKPFEELVYQALNDDPIGRKWAVGQLGSINDPSRISQITILLEDLAINDPVWAVRLASLENLERINGSIKDDILERAKSDPDQRVRNAALKLNSR